MRSRAARRMRGRAAAGLNEPRWTAGAAKRSLRATARAVRGAVVPRCGARAGSPRARDGAGCRC